tara:strand:- start:897 stop:1151 length:255 start_codon:yes stop_codon:yes gene_type:complete
MNIDFQDLIDSHPGLIVMDGFDDCIVGVVERCGSELHFAYSKPKVIERIIEDGCTSEEAVEYFEFNQLGAWVGDSTPCFIDMFE